jgi:hypothetical protein
MNVPELRDADADVFQAASASSEPRWNEPVVGFTDVKIQHYKPKMYLRGFAGPDGKIRRVDLDTGASVRTNVENVGGQCPSSATLRFSPAPPFVRLIILTCSHLGADTVQVWLMPR